jgi:hypothetical protein
VVESIVITVVEISVLCVVDRILYYLEEKVVQNSELFVEEILWELGVGAVEVGEGEKVVVVVEEVLVLNKSDVEEVLELEVVVVEVLELAMEQME